MKRGLPFHSNAAWPPVSLVALFAVIYGILNGGLWLVERLVPNAREVTSDMPEIASIRAVILAGAAGLYAAFRLWRFHPACNPAYVAWLRSSPWKTGRPLPLGPVHLVWQDAAVVGVLTAIAAWHAHMDPALPVGVFGFVYLTGMTLLLAFTRTWTACLVLGFLWPAPMLPGMDGLPTIGLITALVVVIWLGHRKSLRAFPWHLLANSNRPVGPTGDSVLHTEIRIAGLSGTPAADAPSNVGWPYLALSPKVQCHSISIATGFFISVLAGWWAYCAIARFQIEPVPGLILFFAVVAAVVRLAIYCSGMAPPFNVWGRTVSGRLVVPGFDKVFLTPLAVVLLAIAGGMIIRRSGAGYPLAESGVIAALGFVLFSGGPNLRKWSLTGQHRYRLPARLGANKQQLRSV